MQARLGIEVTPLELGPDTNINPEVGSIIFSGDGYMHGETRRVVARLMEQRAAAGHDTIAYVHVDAHDDISPKHGSNGDAYHDFVLGVQQDTNGHAYILKRGLIAPEGADDDRLRFIMPAGPDEWGEEVEEIPRRPVYLSIDLDVLDRGLVHNLFDQEPIGFDMQRLLSVIDQLGSRHEIVGADLVGFSKQGATPEEIERSLANIARIVEKLTEVMQPKVTEPVTKSAA
jgi:arginase family enzyme